MSPGVGDLLDGVRREVERNAVRARNGIKLVSGVEWAPVGPTPSDEVWRGGPACLRRYRGEDPPRLAPPALAVGGLVGRADIFDLTEHNSFVRRMLDAGFDTYVLDWGKPGPEDADATLETYLQRHLPDALRAVARESGTEGASVIAYCMGGCMLLHALAAQRDLGVRYLVVMAAPTDFTRLNALVDALRDGRIDPESLIDHTGNLPPGVVASFFRVLKPTADVVQYAALWQNLWNDQYLEGYQALNRCFQDHVPIPGAAFRQIVQQWIRANGFVEGRLSLDGRRADLGRLSMPTLIVTGRRDELIPAPSSAPLAGLLTGAPVETMVLEAGHASLTVGRTAAKVTVPQILRWLADRSEAVA